MQTFLLGAPATDSTAEINARVFELSGKIICNCGCGNKIVQKCYCGVADAFRQEIRAQMAVSSSNKLVLQYFSSKYGEQILASPVPEGFNLTAWAMPFTALLVGIGLVTILLKRWRRRSAEQRQAQPAPSKASPSDPYEQAFEAEYASRRD
ncbi:MAG: cytochrome c-type biogenesis protein CcmH [Acidobacteriota bacterium]